jgi:hypothetical protein
MLRPPRETPIERIFQEIMRQKMPLAVPLLQIDLKQLLLLDSLGDSA